MPTFFIDVTDEAILKGLQYRASLTGEEVGAMIQRVVEQMGQSVGSVQNVDPAERMVELEAAIQANAMREQRLKRPL
jgi:hypothetical protein